MNSFSRVKLKEPNKVDVIIPVYSGFEETVAAIITASETVDRSWGRVVVINDCTPDMEIKNWLKRNHKKYDFLLLENSANLGFVGTANRGMRLNEDVDILLLNSDVEVANDWLNRLQETAYEKDNIASVTATANNATICSFPVFCEDNELFKDMTVTEIDVVFKKLFKPKDFVVIPTGIGCCMYMRRDAIDKVGYFDEEAFGRGYGEENDWCQRASKKGLDNVHALNTFIYHKGSVSFANEASSRQEANLALIDKKYPNYIKDVHHFIAEDPAKKYRVKAFIELIACQKAQAVLMVSHGMGGGVKTHIYEMIESYKNVVFLLLEPVKEKTVRLNLFPEKKNGPRLDFDLPEDKDRLVSVLKACGVGHVHFHHTMGLPTELWDLAEVLNVKFDYTLHDYYVVNGNPTLTDEMGVYVGDKKNRDDLCARRYPLPPDVSSATWRLNQMPLMSKARYLICPSIDVMSRISNEVEFRSLDNWAVAYHPEQKKLPMSVNSREVNKEKPFRVVVIGALSKEKGADILEEVAGKLRSSEVQFHLLGYAYRKLNDNVIEHGRYSDSQVLELLNDLEPDLLWFTAQWPETYSYTLSFALKLKLPVVAPQLGAFIERLAKRENTSLIKKYNSADECVQYILQHSRGEQPATMDVDVAAPACYYHSFYEEKYLDGISLIESNRSEEDDINIEKMVDSFEKNEAVECKKEKLFLFLLAMKNSQAFSWVCRLVPFRVQKKVKKLLTKKPVHDL